MQYEDDARQYQITVSQNWTDYPDQEGLAAACPEPRLVATIVRSNLVLMPTVQVQTYDISRYPSILSPMDYVQTARSMKRGTELQAPVQFSRGGLTGVRWECAYDGGLMGVHTVTDYYLDGRTVIMVSVMSKPDEFEQDKREAIPMLDSFRFTARTLAGKALASQD